VDRNVVARIQAAFEDWGSSISSCHELPFRFLNFKEKRKALGLASRVLKQDVVCSEPTRTLFRLIPGFYADGTPLNVEADWGVNAAC
jgi:hypothetical protein